jgi:hypothetical protein
MKNGYMDGSGVGIGFTGMVEGKGDGVRNADGEIDEDTLAEGEADGSADTIAGATDAAGNPLSGAAEVIHVRKKSALRAIQTP